MATTTKFSEMRVSVAGAIKIIITASAALLMFGSVRAEVSGNRKDIDENKQAIEALTQTLERRFDRLDDKIDDVRDLIAPGR